MTKGCDGQANFCPDRNATRGENITFAKRYDGLVVQPALTALQAQVAPLTNGAASFGGGTSSAALPDDTDVVTPTLSITAPADGIVVTAASGTLTSGAAASSGLRCTLSTTTEMDFDFFSGSNPMASGETQTMALTWGAVVTAGEPLTLNTVCDAFAGSGEAHNVTMTMIFAPGST